MTTPLDETDNYLSSGSEAESSDSVAESEDELGGGSAPSPYRFEPDAASSDSSISSDEESEFLDRLSDLSW